MPVVTCGGLGTSSPSHMSCVAVSVPLDARAHRHCCSHRLCAHRLHHSMDCVAVSALSATRMLSAHCRWMLSVHCRRYSCRLWACHCQTCGCSQGVSLLLCRGCMVVFALLCAGCVATSLAPCRALPRCLRRGCGTPSSSSLAWGL